MGGIIYEKNTYLYYFFDHSYFSYLELNGKWPETDKNGKAVMMTDFPGVPQISESLIPESADLLQALCRLLLIALLCRMVISPVF